GSGVIDGRRRPADQVSEQNTQLAGGHQECAAAKSCLPFHPVGARCREHVSPEAARRSWYKRRLVEERQALRIQSPEMRVEDRVELGRLVMRPASETTRGVEDVAQL